MGKRHTIKNDPLDALPENPLDLVVPDYGNTAGRAGRGPERKKDEAPGPAEEPKRKVGYQFADEVYWLVKRAAYWERENPSDVAERLLRRGVEAAQEARGEPYPPHPDEDAGER